MDLTHGRSNVINSTPVVDVVTSLGYPVYVLVILGLCKVPGAIVLFLPRLPRLKEWAYAGIILELTAAAGSHAALGHSVEEITTPLILAGLAVTSWALRPPSRTFRAFFMAPDGKGVVSERAVVTPASEPEPRLDRQRPPRHALAGNRRGPLRRRRD